MTTTLCQVTLPAVSGLPEDAVVNTFTLDGPAITQGQTLAAMAGFVEFYNFPGRTQEDFAVAWYLNKTRSRAASACEVAFYNITDHLDGSPHGSPSAVDAFTLGPAHASASSLPDEVACALTLRGLDWSDYPVEAPDAGDEDSLVDRPRQRRTGKIYVGPLNTQALFNDPTTFVGRPSDAVRDAVLGCANRAYDAWQAGGWDWCVWSRKNENVTPIEQVQFDNAFDTQRRRGPAASLRTTLTVNT